MLTIQSHLDVLAHAKELRVSWILAADALLALEATAGRAPDGRTWISIASEVSGFSDNQLRRFTRARAFLQQTELERRGSGGRLRLIPFAHVEVLGKIWQVDRNRAHELIDQARNANSFTYLELLKEYQEIRSKGVAQASPIAAGKHAAQEFINACRKILLETKLLTSAPLYPGNQRAMLRPVVDFDYANPDYVICDTSTSQTPTVEAVDCYFISGRAQYDTLRRKISQVAFESTFFTRFWCLIPPSELAGDFISACNELGLSNVGLVIVDVAKQSCSVIRNPDPEAAPDPDRRQMIFTSRGYKRLLPLGQP